MGIWQSYLKADPISWLLEPDQPAIRYFTLTDILGKHMDDQEVISTKNEIMTRGDVPKILEGQSKGGFWGEPERYYQPRYTGTAWHFMLLAEYGADGSHPEIRQIAEYLYQQAQMVNGGFTSRGLSQRLPGDRGTTCFTGNMIWSCIRLGYLEDPQVQSGIEWIVKYSRFDDGDTTEWPEWLPQDPDDACWGRHTCFRGAMALLQAFAEIPPEKRSPQVQETLEAGVTFLLIHHVYKHSHDLSKPISQYTQLGFPLFVDTEMLRMLLFLTRLGIRDDRMQEAVDLLVKKQDKLGRWKQQHAFPKTRASGFMILPDEEKGQPSKWVTLRALTALKRYYP